MRDRYRIASVDSDSAPNNAERVKLDRQQHRRGAAIRLYDEVAPSLACLTSEREGRDGYHPHGSR
ncbi:MAG: hypothetical protein LZF60_130034 [Nitrospira sp.]|nr:MAG: hypothetical protein LZF60_130034 [Nitrospira sp.]